MQKSVLIVEDDNDILELLKLYLESSNFLVYVAYDGIDALELLEKEKINIIIADIMMPRMNGYELIKKVRANSNIPIMITSAKNMDSDKILGLDMGADAYITKPFNPLEVVAYVKALLRRYNEFEESIKESDVIKVGELSLDLNKYILKKNNKVIPLTSTELKILTMLMKDPGKIFTKSQIYEVINGDYYECDDNTMMVHISNIRSKIEDNPSKPVYIKTVRGLGYKIENKEEL